jgi:hypothetical protein
LPTPQLHEVDLLDMTIKQFGREDCALYAIVREWPDMTAQRLRRTNHKGFDHLLTLP